MQFSSTKISVFILLCTISFQAFSQTEKLFPLMYNQQLKQYWHSQKLNNNHSALKMQAAGDTLKIPVIDDFSYDALFPSSLYWADSNVFINSTFPMNPPSVGVATFDGMDKYGNPYNSTVQGASGLCDSLTSKPINLYDDGQGNLYSVGDSIWLSFFVQRKGLGNSVEANDSLILEFYNPVLFQWEEVWGMTGGIADTVFNRITVKITDAKWLYNGFKFRFSNYGSKSGNLDHWHLDYLILRKVFSPFDNNIDDVAWRFRSTSLLQNFVSIPWSHYKALSQTTKATLMNTTQTLYYANINENPINTRLVSNIDGIFDQLGNQLQLTPGTNTNNISPQSDTTYVYSLNSYVFPDTLPPAGESYEFNIVNRLTTTPDANRSNDTIRYKQVFKSYYAYDDGTAEAGYSLYPAPTGRFAMRFDLLQSDTLRGVMICFSPVSPNTTNNLFRLTVWSQITPEVILYQESNVHPAFIDEVNGFAYYPINDTGLVLGGSIFIGIVQQSANYYGFGFDVNTNNNSRMYYNTNFGWTQSTIPGTWMIRPVFGDSALIASIPVIEPEEDAMTIYPNPANDELTVFSSQFISFEKVTVKIFAIEGNEVLHSVKNIADENSFNLNISQLKKGIYFLQVNDGNKIFSQKVIKM